MAGQIRVSRGTDPSLVIGYGSDDYGLGDGLNVGAVAYDRQYAVSPHVDYQRLVGARKQGTTLIVPVILEASDFEDFETKLQVLVDAFTQFSYTIRYVPRGAFDSLHEHYLWRCECADWALGNGGTLVNAHWQSFAQVVNFSVPRNEATQGPIG